MRETTAQRFERTGWLKRGLEYIQSAKGWHMIADNTGKYMGTLCLPAPEGNLEGHVYLKPTVPPQMPQAKLIKLEQGVAYLCDDKVYEYRILVGRGARMCRLGIGHEERMLSSFHVIKELVPGRQIK